MIIYVCTYIYLFLSTMAVPVFFPIAKGYYYSVELSALGFSVVYVRQCVHHQLAAGKKRAPCGPYPITTLHVNSGPRLHINRPDDSATDPTAEDEPSGSFGGAKSEGGGSFVR